MLTKEQKIAKVGSVFSPSAPVSSRDLFAGRISQLNSSITAIGQTGQHIIIYGERGVGKTSLARVIQAISTQLDWITVMVTCDSDSTFDGLFREILSEIQLTISRPGLGFDAKSSTTSVNLKNFVDEGTKLSPNELRFLFRELNTKTIVVIDEFDRVRDKHLKTLMADLIKNFSDYGVDTTFLIVGVSDSVEDLLSEHESTERALVQIQMPRMSPTELTEIAEKGADQLELEIAQHVKTKIVSLAQGLPHYVHLLCLHASQTAISDSRSSISDEDLETAIAKSIEKAQQSVLSSYHKAISSSRGNMFPQVLLACSLASNDELGYFAAGDIRQPLRRITGKTYEIPSFARHLNEFCSHSRGPILKKIGTKRRYRYRFINPLMGPFIVMKGLSSGMITK